MSSFNYIDLAAPHVPAAEADGLIPIVHLDEDLTVELSIDSYIEPRSTCQLTLNQSTLGEIIELDPVPDRIVMKLPLRALRDEGSYQVGYIVHSFPGGNPTFSQTTLIRIDRTAPGGALLAPMIFTEAGAGQPLEAQVPGYLGMAVGDSLQTLCNGVQGPVYQISDEHLADRPIRVEFARDFLDSLGQPAVTFTYQVRDRAGNLSVLAQPVTVSLGT